MAQLLNNGSMLTNEELEMHTISAWKEGKYQLNREPDGPVEQPLWRPLIQVIVIIIIIILLSHFFFRSRPA